MASRVRTLDSPLQHEDKLLPMTEVESQRDQLWVLWERWGGVLSIERIDDGIEALWTDMMTGLMYQEDVVVLW